MSASAATVPMATAFARHAVAEIDGLTAVPQFSFKRDHEECWSVTLCLSHQDVNERLRGLLGVLRLSVKPIREEEGCDPGGVHLHGESEFGVPFVVVVTTEEAALVRGRSEAPTCYVCGGKGTIKYKGGMQVSLEVCCPNCPKGRALLHATGAVS